MLQVRPATTGDAAAAAEVFLAARSRMTYLPEVHTDEETRAYVRDVVVAGGHALVAVQDDLVVGMASWSSKDDGGWLDGLYVTPDAQGRGVGAALFAEVARLLPDGFLLWVFQDNVDARRFYERRGATLVRETDGADNEERLPDALLHWAPDPRRALLRAVIDSDVPLLYAQQADPEAAGMAVMRPKTREEHAEHMARITSDPTGVVRSIIWQGQLVGTVGCWDGEGERLIGYLIGREHWGRGIATSALTEFLAEVHHRPLAAFVAETNVASRRVLEKCGFEVLEVLEESGDPPITELHVRLDR